MPSELFKRWGIKLPVKRAKACSWMFGDACDGLAEPRQFLDNQVQVYICKGHYQDHNIVEVLTKNHNYDLSNVLSMTPAERKALYYRLVL